MIAKSGRKRRSPAVAASKCVAAALLGVVGLTLAGCDESDTGPYFKIEGGGFIFNYREAEAYYGFVARPLRDLPEGAVLEARFENPDGPQPITIRRPVREGMVKYSFRTPPLVKVEPDHEYRVTLLVLDAGSSEIARYEDTFRTKLDKSVLSDKPLVVGPGYALNPEVDWSGLPPAYRNKGPQ